MLFQLKDHSGNVRAVIMKEGNNAVSLTNKTDYYPSGMPMPNRNVTDGSYRYAYQGQEKDSETGKEAFELRLWDSRIGRWLSPDPYSQYFSPYLGMGNNPINGVDPDGGCYTSSTDEKGNITYTPCPDAEIGSTMIGAFGYDWTFKEDDGWQLTNGADLSSVNYFYNYIESSGEADYYVNRYVAHIKKYNTRPPDYYLEYGYKYINRFKNETREKLSDLGKEWLDETAISLQLKMNEGIYENPALQGDNDKFKSFAYATHVPAYSESGKIGELGFMDLLRITWTPDLSDSFFSSDGLAQIVQMIPHVLKYPKDYWNPVKNPGNIFAKPSYKW